MVNDKVNGVVNVMVIHINGEFKADELGVAIFRTAQSGLLLPCGLLSPSIVLATRFQLPYIRRRRFSLR